MSYTFITLKIPFEQAWPPLLDLLAGLVALCCPGIHHPGAGASAGSQPSAWLQAKYWIQLKHGRTSLTWAEGRGFRKENTTSLETTASPWELPGWTCRTTCEALWNLFATFFIIIFPGGCFFVWLCSNKRKAELNTTMWSPSKWDLEVQTHTASKDGSSLKKY